MATAKRKVLGFLAASLLAGSGLAHAQPVQWLFQGQISVADGTNPAFDPTTGDIHIGDAFSFILHFDPATPVSNPGSCGTGGVGTRCNHNGSPSLFFSDVHLGSHPSFSFDTGSTGQTITVRNDFTVTEQSPPWTGIVDGYGFTVNDPGQNGEFTSFQAIMRGPENLNLVTDGRLLPSVPSPEFLNLQHSGFQLCGGLANGYCYYADVEGRFTSITAVPEPTTYALMIAGLGLLGFAARRRNS